MAWPVLVPSSQEQNCQNRYRELCRSASSTQPGRAEDFFIFPPLMIVGRGASSSSLGFETWQDHSSTRLVVQVLSSATSNDEEPRCLSIAREGGRSGQWCRGAEPLTLRLRLFTSP